MFTDRLFFNIVGGSMLRAWSVTVSAEHWRTPVANAIRAAHSGACIGSASLDVGWSKDAAPLRCSNGLELAVSHGN